MNNFVLKGRQIINIHEANFKEATEKTAVTSVVDPDPP
jgi:hypothetical protein